MIDVVYPLGVGSRMDNLELDYSVRSVRKHLKNVGRIFVIGEQPRTPVGDVVHIPERDPASMAHFNTAFKLIRACRTHQISSTFLLLNDDIFLTADMDAETVPQYCRGTIAAHIEWRSDLNNAYCKSLRQTEKQLIAAGLPRKDFEIHAPLLLNKKNFRLTYDSIDWSPQFPPLFRSLYANRFPNNQVGLDDLKFCEPLPRRELDRRLEGRSFFSIGDAAILGNAGRDLRSFLEDKFPLPKEIVA